MAKRRVSQVVPQRNRLGQLLVQVQDFGDRAGDLRDLERVRQTSAIVIAGRRKEHLGLVLQPAEGLAVYHAVAIALEGGPDLVFRLRALATARVGRLGRLGREDVAFALLELRPDQ